MHWGRRTRSQSLASTAAACFPSNHSDHVNPIRLQLRYTIHSAFHHLNDVSATVWSTGRCQQSPLFLPLHRRDLGCGDWRTADGLALPKTGSASTHRRTAGVPRPAHTYGRFSHDSRPVDVRLGSSDSQLLACSRHRRSISGLRLADRWASCPGLCDRRLYRPHELSISGITSAERTGTCVLPAVCTKAIREANIWVGLQHVGLRQSGCWCRTTGGHLGVWRSCESCSAINTLTRASEEGVWTVRRRSDNDVFHLAVHEGFGSPARVVR